MPVIRKPKFNFGRFGEALEQVFPPEDLGISPPEIPTGPLVTIFKDATERMAATEAFKESARKLGSVFGRAGERFAEKFPRVAAHTSINRSTADLLGEDALDDAGRAFIIPESDRTKSIPMYITKAGEEAASNDTRNALKAIMHEGTHVAQNLIDRKNSRNLYNLAHNIVGYKENPYEIGAHLAHENRTLSGRTSIDAIKNLRDKYSTLRRISATNERIAKLEEEATSYHARRKALGLPD